MAGPKKFPNRASKINAILRVFKEGEMLTREEIVKRLAAMGHEASARGYQRSNERSMGMFIYHNMLHKHLGKVANGDKNLYFRLMDYPNGPPQEVEEVAG
jgi:hypothetical protein